MGWAGAAATVPRVSRGRAVERLKSALGALGHGPGWAQTLRAYRYALSYKRLDRLADDLTGWLLRLGLDDLSGLDAMEFGSGHLLSEPVAMHLAGARSVLAADLYPLLDLRASRLAFRAADRDAVLAAAARTAPRGEAEARYAALAAPGRWTAERLAASGIHYAAGLDAAQGGFGTDRFDLVMSRSVLEHVPGALAGDILAGLHMALRPGGVAAHNIDLRDHRDLARAPFAFLCEGTDWREDQADARGNRLRASDWLALARALPDATAGIEWSDSRPAEVPRTNLLPAYAAKDASDLAMLGVMLVIRKG